MEAKEEERQAVEVGTKLLGADIHQQRKVGEDKMPTIKVNTKSLKKAITSKAKIEKAKTAIKKASIALFDLGKDISNINIGLEKNKQIKSIELNKKGNDYLITISKRD